MEENPILSSKLLGKVMGLMVCHPDVYVSSGGATKASFRDVFAQFFQNFF
jgi:hypothetical protein